MSMSIEYYTCSIQTLMLKTIFMLNSTNDEISTAHKTKLK